jgi:guanylate kinase
MSAETSGRSKGHVFVIAAPSGTGKTTLCRRLLERDPRLKLSVSHTTRDERDGERDGVDYHFVTTKTFREMTDAGAFLEHAAYNRHLYGTSWAAIEGPLESGQDVVLEIEVQGAGQVKERRGDAVLIFLLPPSLGVLEKRLRGRGTDGEDVIQRRMALVDRELAAAPIFDFSVVNDALDRAVDEVLEVIAAVREGRTEAVGEVYGLEIVLARWRADQARSRA